MLHKSFFPHTLRELPVIMLHANDRFSFVARVVLGSCWSANTGLFVFSPCDIYGEKIMAPPSFQIILYLTVSSSTVSLGKASSLGKFKEVLYSSNHCVYLEVNPNLDSKFFAAGASEYTVFTVLAWSSTDIDSLAPKGTRGFRPDWWHTFHSKNIMALSIDHQ